jgi:hypothetical protein
MKIIIEVNEKIYQIKPICGELQIVSKIGNSITIKTLMSDAITIK